MATSTYTRRAFASGASLAALATPVVAFPTLAAVNASPDHELLVLGAQLRRATVLMNETMDVFEAIWEPIEERAWASVGGHIVDVMPDRRMGDAEARAYYDRFSAENARLTALAEPEYSFKKAAADAAAHDFDRINGEILKTPATRSRAWPSRPLHIAGGAPAYLPEQRTSSLLRITCAARLSKRSSGSRRREPCRRKTCGRYCARTSACRVPTAAGRCRTRRGIISARCATGDR
jgi:hypothetical protein